MKNLVFVLLAVVYISGCSSSTKKEQTETVPSQGENSVDSSPMSFDAAGSDSGKIDGLVTVHFDYDKATLSSVVKKELAGNAQWMKSNPKTTIQIEGHCDNRGTIEYNLALGERRAQAVKNYLVGLGIPADKLSIISYGEEKPVLQGDNEEAWSKNRRANFLPVTK